MQTRTNLGKKKNCKILLIKCKQILKKVKKKKNINPYFVATLFLSAVEIHCKFLLKTNAFFQYGFFAVFIFSFDKKNLPIFDMLNFYFYFYFSFFFLFNFFSLRFRFAPSLCSLLVIQYFYLIPRRDFVILGLPKEKLNKYQ